MVDVDWYAFSVEQSRCPSHRVEHESVVCSRWRLPKQLRTSYVPVVGPERRDLRVKV